MTSRARLWAVSCTILFACGGLGGAQAACEGNSCPTDASDAHKAGLLGGPIVKQCSHTKDYPSDGTRLEPVSAHL